MVADEENLVRRFDVELFPESEDDGGGDNGGNEEANDEKPGRKDSFLLLSVKLR